MITKTTKYFAHAVSRWDGSVWYVQNERTSLTCLRVDASEYDAPYEVISRIIALSNGTGPLMENFTFTIMKIERTSFVTEAVVETPLD